MNLSKIHHIAIIVSDYEAAKDFYVNKLGFTVIRENYRPERKDWKLDLHGLWAASPCILCGERGADSE
mgnify:CR=1 FL=1